VTQYEARLEHDLEEIRRGVQKVGGWVAENLHDAVLAMTRHDRTRANETIIRDRAVNKLTEELDHLSHLFVVRHLPSAGHLRFVSSVLRITVALERIGDYSVTVCRETLQLEGPLPEGLIQDIEVIGQQVQNALRSALASFVDGDLEKAAAGRGMAKQVNTTYRKAVADLIALGDRRETSAADLFALMLATRVLKRVGDQAENICEQTAFILTGETKSPKKYRILFVDRDNSLLSIMAEAFGREAYPEQGRYLSSGIDPAAAFDRGFVEFLADRGVEIDGKPIQLEEALEKMSRHYHIVVGIGVNPSKHMDDIPFRTVVLEWDDAEIREAASGLDGRERYQAMYREVAQNVTNLMETLGLETDR